MGFKNGVMRLVGTLSRRLAFIRARPTSVTRVCDALAGEDCQRQALEATMAIDEEHDTNGNDELQSIDIEARDDLGEGDLTREDDIGDGDDAKGEHVADPERREDGENAHRIACLFFKLGVLRKGFIQATPNHARHDNKDDGIGKDRKENHEDKSGAVADLRQGGANRIENEDAGGANDARHLRSPSQVGSEFRGQDREPEAENQVGGDHIERDVDRCEDHLDDEYIARGIPIIRSSDVDRLEDLVRRIHDTAKENDIEGDMRKSRAARTELSHHALMNELEDTPVDHNCDENERIGDTRVMNGLEPGNSFLALGASVEDLTRTLRRVRQIRTWDKVLLHTI